MFRTIQDTHLWRPRSGLAFERLDVKAQAAALLGHLGQQALKNGRRLGQRSLESRQQVLFMLLSQLREGGFAIESLLNLRQRHISYLFRLWHQEGLAPSTIATRRSVIQWLCESLGKNGFVRPLSYYGIQEPITSRSQVGKVDKSWSAKSIDVEAMLAKVFLQDEWVGCQTLLMARFGLRVNEAVMIRPFVADHETVLFIERGSKGGRARVVPITTEAQRAAIERCKVQCKGSKDMSLVRWGSTPKQARDRLYWVFRKLGLTKLELGVTAHGLRHQHANDMYERLTGVPSPVRSAGLPAVVDQEVDFMARTAVTNALGHSRIGVTTAYTGSRKARRKSSAVPPRQERLF